RRLCCFPLRRDKLVDGAVVLGRMEVFVLGRVVVEYLNLDTGRGRMATRRVVDSDPAVAAGLQPIFQLKIEIAVLLVHRQKATFASDGRDDLPVVPPHGRGSLLHVPSGETGNPIVRPDGV